MATKATRKADAAQADTREASDKPADSSAATDTPAPAPAAAPVDPAAQSADSGTAAPAPAALEQVAPIASDTAADVAALATALPVTADGQLVVPSELVKPLESYEVSSPAAGGSALSVEDDDDPQAWYGLQRAVSDVAIERVRQVQGEGFAVERDDAHTNGQLARAAYCYLIPAAGLPRIRQTLHWPFHPAWLKPGAVRADLVKAAALIVAEIERLDRAEAMAD